MPRERGSDPVRSNGRQPDSGLTIAELRQLIALMQRSDIEEIVVEREAVDLKLTLRKAAPVALEAGEREAAEQERASDEALSDATPYQFITAPLVGRFHLGAKPGAKPLVNTGDLIRVGQVVGMIETLNVLTEVEATQAGRIVEVQAQEGQAVEYGQPLLTLEPQTA